MSEDKFNSMFHSVPAMNDVQLGKFMEAMRNVKKSNAAASTVLFPNLPLPYLKDIELLPVILERPKAYFDLKHKVEFAIECGETFEHWNDEQKVTFVFLHMTPEAYRSFEKAELPHTLFLDYSYEEFMDKLEKWRLTPNNLIDVRFELFAAELEPGEGVFNFATRIGDLARDARLEELSRGQLLALLLLSKIDHPMHNDIRNELLEFVFQDPAKNLDFSKIEREIYSYELHERAMYRDKDYSDDAFGEPFPIPTPIPTQKKNRRRRNRASSKKADTPTPTPTPAPTPTRIPTPTPTPTCNRCNEPHQKSECRYKNNTCRYCGKLGHIRPACKSLKRDTELKAEPEFVAH